MLRKCSCCASPASCCRSNHPARGAPHRSARRRGTPAAFRSASAAARRSDTVRRHAVDAKATERIGDVFVRGVVDADERALEGGLVQAVGDEAANGRYTGGRRRRWRLRAGSERTERGNDRSEKETLQHSVKWWE